MSLEIENGKKRSKFLLFVCPSDSISVLFSWKDDTDVIWINLHQLKLHLIYNKIQWMPNEVRFVLNVHKGELASDTATPSTAVRWMHSSPWLTGCHALNLRTYRVDNGGSLARTLRGALVNANCHIQGFKIYVLWMRLNTKLSFYWAPKRHHLMNHPLIVNCISLWPCMIGSQNLWTTLCI